MIRGRDAGELSPSVGQHGTGERAQWTWRRDEGKERMGEEMRDWGIVGAVGE